MALWMPWVNSMPYYDPLIAVFKDINSESEIDSLPELLTAPTCCRFHWLQYQSGRRQLIGAVMPYEDPFQPPTLASKTLRNIGKADQLTRRVRHDLRNNARVQATIATINVRYNTITHELIQVKVLVNPKKVRFILPKTVFNFNCYCIESYTTYAFYTCSCCYLKDSKQTKHSFCTGHMFYPF